MTLRTLRLIRNVLLAVVVIGAGVAWLALRGGDDSLKYAAVFDDASNMVALNDVRLNDVEVGQVKSIALEGLEARVEFTVAPDVVLPAGTRAEVRQASMLGERFLALVPAGKGRLADGSTIPLTHTRKQAEFETLVAAGGELAGSLSAQNVNRLMGAFDGAFGDDPERLGRLIDRTAGTLDQFTRRKDQLAATIDEVERMSKALSPHAGELGQSIERLAAGMDAVADSNEDIGRFVQGLGSFSRRLGTLLAENEERLVAMGPKVNQVMGEITANLDDVTTAINGLYDFNASWSCIGDGNFLNVTFVLYPEAATVDYGQGGCDPEKGQRSRDKRGQVVVEGVPRTEVETDRDQAEASPGLGGFLATTAGGGGR